MTTDEQNTRALVDLVLEFHLKTGADLLELKEFVRKLMEINTRFSIQIVKEEIAKMGRS